MPIGVTSFLNALLRSRGKRICEDINCKLLNDVKVNLKKRESLFYCIFYSVEEKKRKQKSVGFFLQDVNHFLASFSFAVGSSSCDISTGLPNLKKLYL